MKRAAFLIALLPLSACGDYPRDTAGTLVRARSDGFAVGWIDHSAGERRLQQLLAEVETGVDGEAHVVRGAAEPLLAELEAGRLDLVVGTFHESSPWETRVSFSRPLFAVGGDDARFEGRAAVRHGEHAWAIAVDHAVSRAAGRVQ